MNFARNAQVTFGEKPQMKINSLKETKTWISDASLIRKRFLGYRCKLDLVICAWGRALEIMLTFSFRYDLALYRIKKIF